MIVRIIFISSILLILAYLFLQSGNYTRNSEKPIFLQVDQIALEHETQIDITIESDFKPDTLELQTLEKDYGSIWAHLNHLYTTNDIVTGKEYYTEKWFRQLVLHYDHPIETHISRKDEYHDLHIKNWASDALVCTVIDSNAVLTYTYPGQKIVTDTSNFAFVLLFQGDHWRIDAMKVLD